MSAWRASGRVAPIAAPTIALDEMWTCLGARREEKRNDLWVWTAVVEERDGSRWIDFEVGGRDEATFLRLLERLPDAALRDRRIRSVRGAAGQQACGWEVRGGELERRVAFDAAREVESVSSSDKGCAKSVDMLVSLLALVFCAKLKLNTTHH